MTDVHLYNAENIGYFSKDKNPDMDIGKMLSLLEKDNADVNLILCGDNWNPIVMKYEGRLYEFDYFFLPSDNILERIPPDSYWSRLKDRKTITVKPREISEYARRLDSSLYLATEKLLADRLKNHNKDFGVFLNDKNKLVVFSLHCFPYPSTFVEKDSFDYSELMSNSMKSFSVDLDSISVHGTSN